MIISNITREFRRQLVNDREFSLFLLMAMLLGLASGIYNAIFPNYLNDFYHITEQQRGFLEIPREGAGLIVMLVVGAMSFLSDIRLSRLTILLQAAGILGLVLLAPTYSVMVVWLFIFSLGQHVFMPLAPKIVMSLSQRENLGTRLARYSAYGLAASIIGNGFVWVCMRMFHLSYKPLFVCSGVFYICALGAIWFMREDKPDYKKVRFVFRKEYTLYYSLCLTNGARKQIFLTFAPWVLISVFGIGAPVFAVLGIVINVIQVGTRTLVGRSIDKIGEQKVLTAEAVLLVLICLGYGLSGSLFSTAATLIIITACYIIDSSMSVVEMARSTYMRKIAVEESDITPTLSAGTSIDHIASMSIPSLGGILWAATGTYQPVFLAAAGIAVINIILTSRIKIKDIC